MRYLIGVVGAEVNGNEQRQLLSGIVAQAQKYRAQVVTLSNLYNPLEPERADCTDNRIYELLKSDVFDAVILLAESFVNPALRRNLSDILQQKPEIPVVFIGIPAPEFDALSFPYINTSDENDFEGITDYLIETCGFRQIAMLTGPLSLDVSHIRLNGYRKSLEKHGIPYDASLVTEGNFWYNSGEELAKQYLNGERPEPEALLCANDYMAFGLLDAFSAAATDITKHFAVIGYEFIPERNLHTPLLTTFRRNRQALGAAAVDYLIQKLNGEPVPLFQPPQGTIVEGQTCGEIGMPPYEELQTARIERQYADWNLKSEMESKLTESHTIEEFTSIMGEFLFTVRNAVDIVLCLFEDWFRPNNSSVSTLVCRNTNHWADRTAFHMEKMQLPALIRRYEKAAVGYFNPVFFKNRLLGFCMAYYETPDTYDDTYRNWLKSVSNCLEFMRLKGDMRYLLQCRTLSPSYDSITGIFSADGLRDAFHQMRNAQNLQHIAVISFRFWYSQDSLNNLDSVREPVMNLMAAVGIMKRFHGRGGIIGRISEFDFLLLFPEQEADMALVAEAIRTEIFSDEKFLRYAAKMQLFIHHQCISCGQTDFNGIVQTVTEALDDIQNRHYQIAYFPHYQKLRQLHEMLIQNPQEEYSLETVAAELHLNPNHFNRIYKKMYGVSFHHDHILARLQRARHLLLTTDETAVCIAERCGYTDNKYFIRQFSTETGCTPKQYRKMIREYFI